MARLFSSGFELNSTSSGIEWSGSFNPAPLTTSTVRSGTYAMAPTHTNSAQSINQQFATSSQSVIFVRLYFRYSVSLVSALSRILTLSNTSSSSTATATYINFKNNNTLELFDEDGSIGSSSTLTIDTWYCVEVKMDLSGAAGSHIVEGRLDGVVFATSSTRSVSAGPQYLYVGGNLGALTSQTLTGSWFLDDVAVNDNTGSFQNSYPGSGKIIHLKPNATGDSAGWVRQGSNSGANWDQVNDVTPDDITQYVNTTTLNAEDLYNCEASGIGASDTVNCVAVGVRYRGNSATGVPTFVLEVEKTSGGTKGQSSGITPNSTTWTTNANAAPKNYPYTLYQDPDGSNWTQSTLDSMQIGMKITVDDANRADVSAIWALVDYTPAVGGAVSTADFFNML